jgi:hypothetical protein
MEKRAVERIAAEIDTRFFYGNMFYSGTAVNLSERGMFVHTHSCVPANSEFLVIIKDKKELIKISARVKRVTKTEDRFDGMGIELLNPSARYLEFVEGLKKETVEELSPDFSDEIMPAFQQ